MIKVVKESIKKIKREEILNSKRVSYFIILLFSMLLIGPSFFGNFHIGDDQMFHMANILSYAKELPFSLFEKILPEIGNHLGFGTPIFYPALPHIVGALFYSLLHLFGIGLLTTETILHWFIFLTSGITMYWLGSALFKDNKKATFTSLFYITYNYFFVDVVMRDALNEAFMFIFMPLVFLGLYYLFYEHNHLKFYLFFVGGYVGLMYSHLVMSVYFTIFLFFFFLFYVKEILKRKNIIHFIFASILILIFTSTFTVLMLEHNLFANDYVAFAERKMTMENIWHMPFLGYFKQYNYATGNNGLIYANLNFLVILFSIITLYQLIRKKIEQPRRKFLFAIFVFASLGILLNTFIGIWTHMPSILLSIQFIWRLSLFVGFGFALLAAEGVASYFNLFKEKYLVIATLILLVCLGTFVAHNHQLVVYQDSVDWKNLNEYGAVREYFPIKTFENKAYYDEKDPNEIVIVDGQAKVNMLKNDVPYLKFEAQDIEQSVTLELPRFYYLGYQITDENGNKIKYDDGEYGFITITLDKSGIYEVNYIGTFAYQIACIIKSITIIILIIYFGYFVYQRKRKQETV